MSYITNTTISERQKARKAPDGLTLFAKRISSREIYRGGPAMQDSVTMCKICLTGRQDCTNPALHRRKHRPWKPGWQEYRVGDNVEGYGPKIGTVIFIGRYDATDRAYPCIVEYLSSGRTAAIRNIGTLHFFKRPGND